MKLETRTIKIPFEDLISIAIEKLGERYEGVSLDSKYKLMKSRLGEQDSECYELPEYIEIEIE